MYIYIVIKYDYLDPLRQSIFSSSSCHTCHAIASLYIYI